MAPTVGQSVQSITLSAGGEGNSEPGVCAAVVNNVHSEDCVDLTIFPGPWANKDFFSTAEIAAGIAVRTSAVRGLEIGGWRTLPNPDT